MPSSSKGSEFITAAAVIDAANVVAGEIVADLGCGAGGYFVWPTAKCVGKDGLVYAIDIRRPVVEGIAHSARVDGLAQVKTMQANIELVRGVPLPNHSCHVCLLVNVLFQNSNRPEILQEAIRLLKPGGRLVVVDWLNRPTPFGPPLTQRINQAGVEAFCARAGLQLTKKFTPGTLHFGLVFTLPI